MVLLAYQLISYMIWYNKVCTFPFVFLHTYTGIARCVAYIDLLAVAAYDSCKMLIYITNAS